MGFSTRSNTEFVLLATRGRPLRLNADVHQVIMAPVGEHRRIPAANAAATTTLFTLLPS